MLQDDLPDLFPIPDKWALLVQDLLDRTCFSSADGRLIQRNPHKKITPINPDLSLSIVTKLKILLKILTSL